MQRLPQPVKGNKVV